MSEREHFISIWYFIGLLLVAYGVLITGAGIYELFSPAERQVAMREFHAGIWWGALLLALGCFYVYHFSPKKTK
jgi:hypothetical protein